jgi:hypothetical protein
MIEIDKAEESWDRLIKGITQNDPSQLTGRDDDASALMLVAVSVIRDAMSRGGPYFVMIKNLHHDCYRKMVNHMQESQKQ